MYVHAAKSLTAALALAVAACFASGDFEIGKDRMLWNSLCPLDGDSFLLVSECLGRIKVFQGEIKQIERDEQ